MSASVASDMRAGIGARLKAGRERAGLTLLQVAERLHVDPRVVEGVEAERFVDLGAPVYTKGHIKRYSELVGENTAELLDQFASLNKPVLPDLTDLPKAERSATDPKKLVLPSLVVLIAFALIGSIWWIIQNADEALGPSPKPETAEVPGAAEVVPPAEPASAAAQADARPGAAPPSTQPPATNTARTAAAPQSSASSSPQRTTSVRGSATRAGTSAGAASTTRITKTTRLPPPAKAAAVDDDHIPARNAKPVAVTLKFTSDSWAEIYDATGEKLFYDIGAANSSHAVTGTPPLKVVLGNAPGVTVRINGRPAKVPESAVANSGAQFTINRSGRIVRTRPDGE